MIGALMMTIGSESTSPIRERVMSTPRFSSSIRRLVRNPSEKMIQDGFMFSTRMVPVRPS